MISRTLLGALAMAAASVSVFFWDYGNAASRIGRPDALAEAQTAAVTTVASFQIFYMLNCRSLHESVWRIGFFSNRSIFIGIGLLAVLQLGFIYLPWMHALFGSASLPFDSLLVAVTAGAAILPFITLEKGLHARRVRKRALLLRLQRASD